MKGNDVENFYNNNHYITKYVIKYLHATDTYKENRVKEDKEPLTLFPL